MEVKSGYKQTDVGVIPEEWEVTPIISCCEYADYRGKTPPKTRSGTFLITARNVRRGFIDYEESQEYVVTESYEQIMRRGKPRIGDVLITTEAPLGNVAQVEREDVALAQRIIKYRPRSDDLSSNYLKHYLLSDLFQTILNNHGSGSTATGIKGRVLHQLPVVIPPPDEQRAIAGALSDVDALLGALDQLIAKKRDLKQAVMQQLLTGQTRLPDFHGKWGTVTLEDACVPGGLVRGPFGGALKKEDFVRDGKKVYEQRNAIYHDATIGSYFIDEAKFKELKRFAVNTGNFIVSCAGTIGRIFQIPQGAPPGVINQALLKIEINGDVIDPNYFLHYFNWEIFQRSIIDNTHGGAMQNLVGMSLFRTVEFAQPPLAEQTAIAEVLTDLDAELAALEQRRAKTRALKQGMMQELLTGRTRLI